MLGSVGKVLDEVEDVGVVAVQEDQGLETTKLEREEIILLHLTAVRFVVSPGPESPEGKRGAV